MEMPLGLGMALAQNQQAMMLYAALTNEEKQAVIDGTHQIRSSKEMHAYVEQLGKRKGQGNSNG